MTLITPLDRAQSAHQAGRLDEAAQLYAQILHHDPRNFTAVRLLGVLQLQRGTAAEPLPPRACGDAPFA